MQAGLSQAQLAQRLGVSQPLVARTEKGEHMVSEETIRRWAEALGLDVQLVLVRSKMR